MRGDLLDVIFLIIVFLGGFNGYRLGFVRQVTRLFGAVIAYFVSYWLRPYVAPVIRGIHPFATSSVPGSVAGALFGDLSGAIAFGLVFVVVFLLLRYAAGLIDALFSLPVLSFVNRFVGLVAGVALAMVFIYVVVLILHYVQASSIQHQIAHSAIAKWLLGNRFNSVVSAASAQFTEHIKK